MSDAAPESQRLDKWLWHARFFRTRTLASKLVSDGRVRVDGTPVSKPSRTVSAGDTLTFPQGRQIRVIRVVAIGTRRGPASEARGFYEDLTPPPPPKDAAAPRATSGGRPTKKDRRDMDRLRASQDG